MKYIPFSIIEMKMEQLSISVAGVTPSKREFDRSLSVSETMNGLFERTKYCSNSVEMNGKIA
jgi:hypothetical protein